MNPHMHFTLAPVHHSQQRLTSTSGGNGLNSPNEFARKVKNLFTGNSPSMKKRSVSIDTALDSKPGELELY